MPNWCDNTLRISHPDPAIMEKAAAAWNKGEFLIGGFILNSENKWIRVHQSYK
jgi:hypothetical protein